MIGPPFGRGWCLGRPRGSEEEPEGLGDPSRSVRKADVGGKDLPLRVSQIGEGLAHRDTSSGTTMAAALPAGYALPGRRGRYGRAVEVYGITRVARSSAIAFGWCTCCDAPTRWKRRQPGGPSAFRAGWPSCSGLAWICETVTR